MREPRQDTPNSKATLASQVPPTFTQLGEDEQDAVREALQKAAEQQGASGACASDGQLKPECTQTAADALVQKSVEDLVEASGGSASDVARAVSGRPLATVAVANAVVDTAMRPDGKVRTTVVAVTSPPKGEARRPPTRSDQTTTPEGQTGGEGASETQPEGGGGSGGTPEGGGGSGGGGASEGGSAPDGG